MRILVSGSAAVLAFATVPVALGAQSQAPVSEASGAEAPATEQAPAGSASGAAPAPLSANEANAQAAPRAATITVAPETPRSPATVTRNNPGNLAPPPASALNNDYPTCTAELQDSCRNPGGR